MKKIDELLKELENLSKMNAIMNDECEMLRHEVKRLKMIVYEFDPEQHPYRDEHEFPNPAMREVYDMMKEQLKELKKENPKLKVERNKAVRQLESFKKKISKIIGPVEK